MTAVFGNAEQVINVCGSDNFTVIFEVVANTDAGAECNDTDVFQFVPPPVRRLSLQGTSSAMQASKIYDLEVVDEPVTSL